MRKIKEVLRLHLEAGLSERKISKICVKGTVRRFLKRAEAAGLSWPLPPSLDDAALEKKLFPPPRRRQRASGPNQITPPFTRSSKARM
jgi:hypothetical protein